MTPDGLALLTRFEGFRGEPYHDAANVLTVGYGTTFPLSDAEGMLLVQSRLAVFEPQVRELVERDLAPHQLDALVDFAYNEGIRAFAGSSVLHAILNGNLEAVPAALRMWTKAHVGGRLTVMPGLVARREAEIALWNAP